MTPSLDRKILKGLLKTFDGRAGREYFYGPFLSAAIAGRDEKAMQLIMETAVEDHIPVVMVDEIILQSHLFLGFPAMIEASRMFAKIINRRLRKKKLPGPYSEAVCRQWNKKGTVHIKSIYGPAFDRLVGYINSFSPQILTWMINDGYGQVLSRPGASFSLRELSVVATLTVTSYVNQLGAHIRGTVNVGVDPDLIHLTMDNCRYFCSRSNIKKAQKILSEARIE